MIYDLLPGVEEFCTHRGGAISKVVANVMRFDSSRVAVASASNDSWGLGRDRILVIPELLAYEKIRGRRYFPRWMGGRSYRRIYTPLLSRLRHGDVVWCHNQPHTAEALESSISSSGAKLVYHSHDRHIPKTSIKAFKSIKPSAWIFASEALRQRYLASFPHLRDTYVIHNGADEDLFHPASAKTNGNNGAPVILYVGRLHQEKGPHVLVKAMQLLKERNVTASCKIVGSSFSAGSRPTPFVRSLHSMSPPNVEFLGYRPPRDVAKDFRAADIVCCPSICEEGFGNVNVEGMACGLPVVATRVGGIPEIAAKGGIRLVEPNSSVELADALQELVIDADLRAKIGAEGLAAFQSRFTWAAIARQYSELVERL